MRLSCLVFTTLALTAATLMAAEPPLSIRNGTLEVKLDASGGLSIATIGTQRTFVRDGAFAKAGQGRIVPVSDGIFGAGQAIEVAADDGSRGRIMLFPGLPFALVRSSLRNAGDQPSIVNKVPGLKLPLDLGKPAGQLRVLGTGGLKMGDASVGSYVWLAVADPATRNGVVAGWLASERGSGVVFSSASADRVQLAAELQFGRLRLGAGKTEELGTFAVGFFDDARLGLEAWADAVAKVNQVHLPPQPVGYCTWYHAGASNEKEIATAAALAREELVPFGFSVMQIDDGWQDGVKKNGPRKDFTRVRANGPYPAGMQQTAQAIRAAGLTPGLWFMPFAGTFDDPHFKDHQEWFVKREDGKPYDTSWGGTCLDMTHPGARDYLRGIVTRITREWGFTYLKMDGLYTGLAAKQVYINDAYKEDGFGDAVFHDPSKTNIQAYRDGLRLVREAAGRDVFILGCCIPQNMRSYGGAFGLVDAMRIGPDNGTKWDGILRGPRFGSRHYFLHGRVWYNDPDPVYVRPSLTLSQARSLCSWVALSGQLNLSSEAYAKLPPERLDILKRTMPAHGAVARPVDLFDDLDIPRIWLVTDTRTATQRNVIGLYNWRDKPATIECPMERMGLSPDTEYLAFDYWENTTLPPIKGTLKVTVPAESCLVLAIRPKAQHPQIISTSRHVTQGMIDILEETWDGPAMTLRGRSLIIGGDPYELRIIPAGYKAENIEVSSDDAAAGVKAQDAQADGLLRVKLNSPITRSVSWRVRFSPAR